MAWNVTTAGSALEFDTTIMLWPAKPIAIDTNHFFIVYAGSGSDGFAEVLTVNTSTWAVTTSAARLEHDTQNGLHNSVSKIDTNHFINFYLGGATTTDGFAQVFTVNTSTWAVTTSSARFLFDTDVGSYNSSHQVDANHFINFWAGNSADGFAQTFVVNTTTWAVTTSSSQLEFDTQNCTHNASIQIDTNHFVNVWLGGATTTDLRAQVFTVNTTTWAVTTANSALLFDTDVGSWNSILMVDSNHFINFWTGASGDGFAQVLTINTSTWAVTTAGSQLEFDTQEHQTNGKTTVARVDTNHFIHVWAGPDSGAASAYDGFAQIFEVNTTTWEVTTSTAPFEFDTTQGEYNSISEIIAGTDALTGTGAKFLNLFSGSGDDGFAQVLSSFNQATPTIVLNSPADASSTTDTTPTFDFTGTDLNGDDIRYRLQIHTDSSFGTTITTGASEGAVQTSDTTVSTLSTTTKFIAFMGNHQGTMSACTLDGVSLTKMAGAATAFNETAEIWYLDNPGAKTNVTLTGTYSGGSGRVLGYICLEGTKDGTYNQKLETSGSSSTATGNITPTADNCIILTCAYAEENLTQGSGETNIFDVQGASYEGCAASYVIQTTAATQTVDFSLGSGQRWALCAVAIESIPPLIDVISGTDSGFANPDNGGDTDPFTSGENIQYTPTTPLDLDTYYWRVAGADPSGSNTYGEWSSTRSLTIEAGSTRRIFLVT